VRDGIFQIVECERPRAGHGEAQHDQVRHRCRAEPAARRHRSVNADVHCLLIHHHGLERPPPTNTPPDRQRLNSAEPGAIEGNRVAVVVDQRRLAAADT
jgi:hypothetical protein